MQPAVDYAELLRGCYNKLTLSEWFKSLSVREYAGFLDSEVHEIVQAIDNQDVANLKEELGDVFWGIHALILKAGQQYGFSLDDVVSGVLQKYKNRKPHIFNGVPTSREDEVARWHRVKEQEKNLARESVKPPGGR